MSVRLQTRRTRHAVPRVLTAVAASAAMCLLAAPGARAASDGSTSARAGVDTGYALVQLTAEPLATWQRSAPAKGKKIDFSSTTVKSYRALLSAARNDYKAWLRANVPQASVSGEFDISLNAVAVKLNGATLAQVAATPLVRQAEYQGLYYPNAADPDLALIDAEAAWNRQGGAAQAGAGVKVAVVDSGIDTAHPCFSDTGYPAQSQLGDRRYTNNKVIAARVFNNRLNQTRFDAKAVGAHGTHVAGTVACNFQTPASVGGVSIPYAMSGVAPRALLGSYNVFPGTVESARSEDILNALEAAYSDGFDVANMSLGGGSKGVQDLLTVAVDNLDRANLVVAISNGNEGPGAFTVGSPGMAARGLTAGASSVPHFVGSPVLAGNQRFGSASGDFATVQSDLTAPLAAVLTSSGALSTACTALPPQSLNGAVALLSRGTCTFSVKVRNAQAAGAAAVLVANSIAGDPTAMGFDTLPTQPTIPAYMVSRLDGQALLAYNGMPVTIVAEMAYFSSVNANLMAQFSSLGPTDVDFRVKPDVVAPGVNVLSSVPTALCSGAPCFAFYSGTSMAAPHLAGSAAVLRGQHPDWSAAQVRSAVVNTAVRGVLGRWQDGQPINDVQTVGAGLENLLAATTATLALDPVSLSFGGVPSGSGMSRAQTITVTNLSGVAQSLSLSVGAQPAGVRYSVSPSALALDPGASATVTVTMQAAVGAAGPQQAYLDIFDGSRSVAHAALYTLIK